MTDKNALLLFSKLWVAATGSDDTRSYTRGDKTSRERERPNRE